MVTRKPTTAPPVQALSEQAEAFLAGAPDARRRKNAGGKRKRSTTDLRQLNVKLTACEYERFYQTTLVKGTTMTFVIQRLVHDYIQRHKRAVAGAETEGDEDL